MNFRAVAAVLVTLLGVSILSCQSNVDKAVDWYEKRDKTMRSQFPTMTTCDRNEREWWQFNAEVEKVIGNYTRAMAGVGRMGCR